MDKDVVNNQLDIIEDKIKKYEEFKKNSNAELNTVLTDISKGKSIISECLAKG